MRFAHGDLLNIASDGGRRVDSFFSQTAKAGTRHFNIKAPLNTMSTTPEVYLQLVQDGCLSSIVQTHNDDFVFWRKSETSSKLAGVII